MRRLRIDKVSKLDLHAGDRLLVHLNRKPTAEEKDRLTAQIQDAIVAPDVKVIVLPPGADLEVQR